MAAFLIPLLAGLGGSLFGRLFGGGGGDSSGEGSESPLTIPPIWPRMQTSFGDWLFSNFQEGGGLAGAPAYPNPLSPSMDNMLLNRVWSGWEGWDPGLQYLSNYLQGGQGPGSVMETYRNSIEQFGGIGGRPTQFMNTMAEHGGVGQRGAPAMYSMLEYGVPSAAGHPMMRLANQGISSEGAGAGLRGRAAGTGPAINFLAPFLAPRQSFQLPGIQSRAPRRGF